MRPLPVLAVLGLLICPAVPQTYWSSQRDDLREYQLVKDVPNARSILECSTLAEEQHHACSWNPADAICHMFTCLYGANGCRKCRNAVNSSLPVLLVKQLNQLGHSCWRTFQHRVDGSVDFYRTWTDYLSAFGQGENANHWMGLEAIHQLTKAGDRRARWEMSFWNGSWFWWEDASFTVQGADAGFRVTLGDQDVTNSNVVRCPNSYGPFMNNMMFTTCDKDQDTSADNCAVKFQGAWWYGSCHCFNPNGRYFTPPTAYNLSGTLWADGLTFQNTISTVPPLNHYYSMKTFECMISDFL